MNRYKTFFLVLTFFLFTVLISRAQSPVFVQQETMLQSNVTTDAQIYPLNNTQKQTSRIYYDGLGRPLQSIAVQASPAQNDLIQPVVYDNVGRQTVSYLPYAGQSSDVTGSYRTNAVTSAQSSFYNQTSQYLVAKDGSPYAQKVFENSPLQRLLTSGMVGAGYQPTGSALTGGSGTQHFKSVSYRSNNASDGNIIAWNPDGSYTNGTYYQTSSLAVVDGKDEAGVETLTFTDFAGHLILKRQIFSPANLDTYYIYNNSGLPGIIVPPKAVAIMTGANNFSLQQANVAPLLFVFAYDTQGRLTNKTVPGKGTMNIVYDPMNRPVLVQDANLAASYKWNYIKYDVKGRVVSQGIYTDPNQYSQTAMQIAVTGMKTSYQTSWFESKNGVALTGYYTNSIFPTTNIQALAYAFYDNYDLLNNGSSYYSYTAAGLTNEVGATSAQVKGMPTMTLQSTVSNTIAQQLLISVQFYDRNLRPVQTKSNNLLYYTNSTTVTDTKTTVPDFVGAPTVSKTVKQSSSTVSISVQTAIGYDQMHRVTTVDQSYNSAATVRIATYVYNELGQLVAKKLGSAPGASTQLQQVDFRYNIRGQLLSINNSTLGPDAGQTDDDSAPVFGMQLLYDQTDANVGNTPYYNGKLSAVKWMSKNTSGANSYERSFKYTYDGVDRYKSAIYGERASGSASGVSFGTNSGGWNEVVSSYDENGNINGLSRNASTPGAASGSSIDNLTYGYNPNNANQLYTVSDNSGSNMGFGIQTGGSASGNYVYDVNGNLKTDPYKALTLGYNVINRTDKITFTGYSGRYINYIYGANGTVMEKQQYDAGTLVTKTDYLDGFVYVNGALAYFSMPEGRVLYNGGTLTNEYVISDQQGNARVSFNNSGTGGTAKVVQENSYYGFGMVMPGSVVSGDNNKNLYNGGSEWQNDYTNLPDYYQTYYRNYDAALGRFIGPDPQAESTNSMTTYQYANNNPIMFNDPLGNLSDAQWAFVQAEVSGGISGNYEVRDGVSGYDETDDNGNVTHWDGGGGGGGSGGGSGGAPGGSGGSVGASSSASVTGTVFISTAMVINNSVKQAFSPQSQDQQSDQWLGILLNVVNVTASANKGDDNQESDPYSYAGNFFHVPATNLPSNDGSNVQTANTCVFCTIAAGMTYRGKKIDGLTVLDRLKIDGKVINDVQETAIIFGGLPNSLLESTYDQFFAGSFVTTTEGFADILLGNPLLGTYKANSNMLHDVFITGISYFSSGPNSGFNFAFWNPATGYYGAAPTKSFILLYSIPIAK
jgi:RHS repeat-associated protein